MSFQCKTITLRKLNAQEKEAIVRPFLRWVGGKQKLLPSLMDRLPSPSQVSRYYEPFLGGGSLFLACGFGNAVLADLNPALINCYEHVREHPAKVHALLQQLQREFLVKKEPFYYEVRELFNRHIGEPSLIQCARFIFLNHTNFNGYYRVNQNGQYNTPFGKRVGRRLPDLPHLRAVSRRLQEADLRGGTNYDEVIQEAGEGDFIYLDPPYPVEDNDRGFSGYTIDRFGTKDQRLLAELAHTKADEGAWVMISNVRMDIVEKLYKDNRRWHKHSIPIKRQMGSKRQRMSVEELVITSYKP